MRPSRDELQLQRLSQFKTAKHATALPLGPEMVEFFKSSVAKRQTKLSQIAECWARLVPSPLLDHTSLEGYVRSTLTVLVDSSPHLYDLKQLLLAGLQQQLLLACKSAGLRKIQLKPGRWYDEEGADRKLKFQ